jgi:hypothetical protein
MSENVVDSETISKPAPDTTKPKGARKAAKKPMFTVHAHCPDEACSLGFVTIELIPRLMKQSGQSDHAGGESRKT